MYLGILWALHILIGQLQILYLIVEFITIGKTCVFLLYV